MVRRTTAYGRLRLGDRDLIARSGFIPRDRVLLVSEAGFWAGA